MQLFASKRSKRNTAFSVTFAWLFALASGAANGCLLETPGTHSHAHLQIGSPAPEPTHVHAAPGDHSVIDDDDDGDQSGIQKGACLKACDDGSRAAVKVQANLDMTCPGLVPLVAVAWDTAAPVVVSAFNQRDDLWPLIVGPPFRVRYSRLAL